MRHRRTLLVLAAVTVSAGAACSPTDEVTSTSDPTTTTGATTTTIDTTTTLPEATTIPGSTTTTVPETTTTVEPTTTTQPPATSTTAPGPALTPPAVAYVVSDADLVEIDTASGAVTRIIAALFNGDGLFRGSLRLSPDATTIWFSEGYEDGWYGCETSVGSFGRVDVATGAIEIVGTGSGVEPSPDGSRIVYLTSALCLPDPENPESWVLTPYDRVVVRDLASGAEQVFVTNPSPQDDAAPSRIEWAGFTPEGALLVRTADARLWLVDPNGPGVVQEHPVVLEEVRGVAVGATAGALITIDYGTEGSADLYAVDQRSGAAAPLASSERFVTAGVAANGAIVVAGFGDIDVEPGAPVTVLTAPDGVTYFDLDW